VLKLTMGGIIPLLPYMPSRYAHRQLDLNHEFYILNRR